MSIASRRRSARSGALFGEFYCSASELPAIFQRGLELFEQRKRVRGVTRESGDHLIIEQLTYFDGIAFMTVSPMDTWPSPPTATVASSRTLTMVVP